MKQSEVIAWMDKRIELYKEIMSIREIKADGMRLTGCDYCTGEMQYSGNVDIFMALAATVGEVVKTEVHSDLYVELYFYYKGVKFFCLMNNPFEKEDQ